MQTSPQDREAARRAVSLLSRHPRTGGPAVALAIDLGFDEPVHVAMTPGEAYALARQLFGAVDRTAGTHRARTARSAGRGRAWR